MFWFWKIFMLPENQKQGIKILFISPAYWPAVSFGGPIVSIKLLAENLRRLNNCVFVYTSSFGLENNQDKKETINGVEVSYFRHFLCKRWIISPGLIGALFKNRNDFDIYHLNLVWDPISWISGFVLAIWGKKFIISPRGTIEESLIGKRSFWPKKIIYFLLIKFIFKKCSGFHFTSEKEKEEFFKFTKIKKSYVIVSNLFNYDEFKKEVNKNLVEKFKLKDKKYILCFGRISWKKRIELLIDAFSELSEKYNDLYLAILGSADDKNYYGKLQQKIKDLKLENKVVLAGEIIGGDLKIALYQNAFCFVLPSISENFGYVVVEAMACKIPVVVSSGVGLKELVEKYNAGLVFDCINDNELKNNLVSKIKLILDNKKLKENLINNGLLLLKNEFNNEFLAQKMLEFYYQAVEK